MPDIVSSITRDLTQKIESFKPQVEIRDVGVVTEAGDGIARADGLSSVRSQELVQFENGVMGIAFNLEKNSVGIIILGDYSTVTEGMQVRSTGRIASVPVGDGLVGRVVNALGEPVDGKGALDFSRYLPIERIAPNVVERQDVDTPVQTGIKAIDAMIPIGRGQRELIIGDRQTGKLLWLSIRLSTRRKRPYLYLCGHRTKEIIGGPHNRVIRTLRRHESHRSGDCCSG
jgi:F-type H+-transporting ATPase subunit alpha